MSSTFLFLLVAGELALLIGGVMLLWKLGLSPRARAIPAALAPWAISITEFFMLLWLVLIGGFLFPFSANLWFKRHPVPTDLGVILATVFFDAGMLAGILVFRATVGRRRAPADLAPRHPANPLLAGLTTFLISLPVVLAVSLVWQNLLKALNVPMTTQEAIDILRHSHDLPRVILLACAIVLAPITEELVFRAGIFRYARTRVPRWAALLLPAMLFGAMHMNLASLAPLIALGVIYSLAYERTGQISTSIIAHSLFNLTTTMLVIVGIDV